MVRRDRYAWPGGYALALVTADGALLCPDCVAAEWSQIAADNRSAYRTGTGWKPAGITGAHESDETEHCAHCGRIIWEGNEP